MTQLLGRIALDLRLGVRLWMKQPGSFICGSLALTLGIGLVTFSLSALNSVFFGRLPFPQADRLVYVTVPRPDLRAFQEQQTTFEGLSAFGTRSANFKALEAPTRRRVSVVGVNFLEVLRATPLLGRGFRPGEDLAGAEPVALIGYDLWQREFRGSPDTLGAVIRLDGLPRTVVGIMPTGFKFPIDDQLWIPAEPGADLMSGWGFAFGRLKHSATPAEARRELDLIAARLAPIQASERASGPTLIPPIKVGAYTRFLSDLKGPHGPGPGMFAMLILTLLVLFIACANVAGLTLANASRRGTELAVRGALGATRVRLISQMLTESLILAVVGAIGGLLILAGLIQWFESWFTANEAEFSQIPFWMHLEIDGRLFGALLGLVLLANLLAGLWPALQATKRDVQELLKDGTTGSSGIQTGAIRRFLVMAQIAFTVIVLTQSVVLLRFSLRLKQVSLPFDPAAVLTARVDLPMSPQVGSTFEQLEQNLAGLPGVNAAALSTRDPSSGHVWTQLAVEGAEIFRPEDYSSGAKEIVSRSYFPALNLPLLQGLNFNSDDGAGGPSVVIVNGTFAQKFLPPGSPLGRRFREGTNNWLTVVGCVADLQYEPLTENPQPVYYLPLSQHPVSSMVVLLRGSGRAVDWTQALRTEVARLQPDLAIYRVATIQTLIDHQIFGYHLASLLMGICGAGALFLATLGIFGLISLCVNQRTREIGVRLALGARPRWIVVSLLKDTIRQIAAGLCVGALLGYLLNQVLTHTIAGYPNATYPALVILLTAAFLGIISLLAVLVPAVRGAKIDPMAALRYE